MKTPDEIKKDLQHCSQRTQLHCLGCSHDGESFCTHKLTAEALAYIQQLERERDALQAALKATDPCNNCKNSCTARGCDGECCLCDHWETCVCLECDTDSHWEWAGIKEDNA